MNAQPPSPAPALGRPRKQRGDERYGYTSIRLPRELMEQLDRLIDLKRQDGHRVSRNSVIERLLEVPLARETQLATVVLDLRQQLMAQSMNSCERGALSGAQKVEGASLPAGPLGGDLTSCEKGESVLSISPGITADNFGDNLSSTSVRDSR